MKKYYFLSGIGQLLTGILTIYGIMLGLRIILSWLPIRENRWTLLLKKFTDPVLDFFTKNFPINLAGFNISILFPFLIIGILSKLISDFMILQAPINSLLLYLLGLLIWIVIFFYEFFAFVLIFFLVIFLIAKFTGRTSAHPIFDFVQNLINPVMLQIHKILKLRSRRGEIIYIVIILIGIIIIAFIGDHLLKQLFILLDYYSKQSRLQKEMIDAIFERE